LVLTGESDEEGWDVSRGMDVPMPNDDEILPSNVPLPIIWRLELGALKAVVGDAAKCATRHREMNEAPWTRIMVHS